MKSICLAVAALAALCPSIAMADDPLDPAMRNAAARARDRAEIQRLNREQLAYVQQRDAEYREESRGWREWHDRGGAPQARADAANSSAADRDYADARARYQADLAAWRKAVDACRAGDYRACGG